MFVKEGLYECHCHNVSVLRLSLKRLILAFMSCYKMSCYHHQRFCLARCGQKGCLIGTCKKKWSSKCIFMLAIKSFCVCVLSLCVQSSQNYGCKLNYQLHICKLETNYVVSYFCIAVTKTPLATVIQLNKT